MMTTHKFEGYTSPSKPIRGDVRSALRRATAKATNRFSDGGKRKTGNAAPKAITLPSFNLPEEREE